jgi:hypothetical protein
MHVILLLGALVFSFIWLMLISVDPLLGLMPIPLISLGLWWWTRK